MFYIKIATIHLLLSILAAGCIFFFFHYPMSLLVTHAAICLQAYLLCVSSSVAIGLSPSSKTRDFFQPVFFSLVSTLLILIYVGDWVSNYFWKANLDFNLISRMFNHYLQLHPVGTVLIVGGTLLTVFSAMHFFYLRIYKKHRPAVQRPNHVIFLALSFTIFISIQGSSLFYNSNSTELNRYFYGELVFDLFTDYTDSHSDYLANADAVVDRVSQSVNYIEQRADTVNTSKKNIILVIVDCLRADHLVGYGYERDTMPNLKKFMDSHNGIRVKHFFSICDESKCGIRSILTSRGFREQSSVQASENSLHSKLKESGYQINFLLSSDHAFGGLKRIYHPYDFYIDGMGFKNYPLNDDRGIVSILEGWPAYNGSPNYFHFHLFSAHEAGISFGKYLGQAVMGIKPGFQVEDPIEPRYFTVNADARQELVDWQDNKIFQADLIISRIFSLLAEKGYMDNALVVVTGDHGQGLKEHGYFGHISGLFNESLHVPLMLADTSNELKEIREKDFGTQLDIAPTVLSVIDQSVPDSWEGTALQHKKITPQITQHVIPNRSKSFAKIFYDPKEGSLYKYMFLSSLGGMKEERFFFDLVADPGEQHNLLGSEKNRESHLRFIATWGLDKFDN